MGVLIRELALIREGALIRVGHLLGQIRYVLLCLSNTVGSHLRHMGKFTSTFPVLRYILQLSWIRRAIVENGIFHANR